MKTNLRKAILGAALVGSPMFMHAQETIVTADAGDGTFTHATVPILGGEATLAFKAWESQVGNMYTKGTDYKGDPVTGDQGAFTYIVPFKLPAMPNGLTVESVSMTTVVKSIGAWIPKDAKLGLYAINDVKEGSGITAEKQASYNYHSTWGADASATAIQEDFIVRTTVAGAAENDINKLFETSGVANQALKTFISEAYANGHAGKFVFFRVNNDGAAGNIGDYQAFNIYGFDNATDDVAYPIQDKALLPKLIITFGGADETAPTFEKVTADKHVPKKVVLTFNEALDKVAAETVANYTFDPAVGVVSATLNEDLKSITLITEDVIEGNFYNINISGVSDLAGNNADGKKGYLANGYSDDIIASSFQNDQWGNNPAANAFDADAATLWSADGIGEWLEKTYEEMQTIKTVSVAYPKADDRTYTFSIQVSEDGVAYTEVEAVEMLSQTEEKIFDITDVDARYVRFVGAGNSTNAWNKFSEVVIESDLALSSNKYVVSSLDVSPNPSVNGSFMISATDLGKDATVTVLSITGKVVYSAKVNTTSNVIAVDANLNAGIYIVQLVDGEKVKVQKLIVK
ncbi:MAG: discoidin domain-containing protein [Ichthyobacteriaceae bacterium]|nr:discoidin domain-containing protein [Ichthyobacteriaceae bacterium]